MSWSRESIFLVLLFLFLKLKTVLEQHCDLLIDDRSECGFPGIEKIQCEERNCCWIPFALNDIRNPPWCSEPANKSCGYKQITPTTLQDRCNSTRFANISVQYIGTSILRVSITRSFNEFTVPSSLFPNEAHESSFTSELRFESFNDDFGNFNFKIIRLKDSSIIWDTNLPGNNSMSSIQMKNQYTQIGSRIPKNHNIYGLGYHAGPLKIPEGTRLALYSRDAPSLPGQNLYSAHPFYLQLQNGTAHGVYMRNSFGMDVIAEKGSIKFKMLGGPIDLFFFAGTEPLDVLSQYTSIIGKPAMFDYRILGFHQSRYGYRNVSQIQNVLDGFEREKIPLDTIWLDIDYMDSKKDFTLDPINFPRDKMNQLLKRLVDSNQRIVPILDPGIKIDEEYGTYTRGLSRGIFVKNPPKVARYGGKYFVGQVWPGNVHFIDFTHENASKFLSEELRIFFNQFDNLHVFAGLWLDMNEPSNFIDGYNYNLEDFPRDYASFSLNFPRYSINNGGDESPVYQKTIPMDSLTQLGTCYQTHNMYGIFESKVLFEAMKELNHPIGQARPFLLTRSTFPGSGRWTATWLGDNLSTFSQMALSIPGILQYGLAGIPMSGPDICGFLGEASEELCARWMALGAFYPFSRNHNSIESTQDQEPYNWKSVAHISRRYLQLRYSLHPYYYTLMHTAHVKGWPIWRPIFFYDASEEAKSIDDQVFIGSDLLLSPVLMESKRSLIVRLPKGEWYEWDTLNFIKTASNAIKVEYSAPIDFISLHLRAGAIILLQPSDKLTMYETRKADFKLLIALNTEGKARGCVYWDDGKGLSAANHTIEIFTEAKQGLGMKIYFSGLNESVEAMPKIKEITVLTAGRRMGRLREESWYNWSFLDSTGNFELKMAAFAGVTMNRSVNLKFE